MDRWVKCVSETASIRGVSIQAKELVQSVIDRHELTDEGSKALGEVLIG
ncbi:MAG: Hsp33 family molecular chaperone HslO, partial [Leptospiraceae bacterium]|nr:Hsp33 family molecular chaperone HslO [Leptospiraceae bacterium]